MIKYVKRKIENFKNKSLVGKIGDVFFLLLIIMFLMPNGRVMMQRTMLYSGLFNKTVTTDNILLTTKDLTWQLEDFDGKPIQLEELTDKPVFLNFWATWCPPCRAEMPSITELYKLKKEEVNFVFISNEPKEKIAAFMNKNGYDLPLYFARTQTPEALYSTTLPTTVVIDKNNTIVHKSNGMHHWSSDASIAFIEDLQ